MPVHNDIVAGNIVKPEVPDEGEVPIKQTHEYEPVRSKSKSSVLTSFTDFLSPGNILAAFGGRGSRRN